MPRFFVDTFGGVAIFDDEGYDLPDQSAAKDLVHRVLSDMMSREKTETTATRLRADVRNEAGKLVMTARLVMFIDEFEQTVGP